MQRRTKLAALPGAAAVGFLVAASAATAFEGVERFTALDRLPELDPSMHVAGASSHARDGTNGDVYLYVVGEPDHRPYLYRDDAGRFVLMEAAGPGAITRLWMTEIAATSGDTTAAGNLQIFFDGE